MAPSISSPSPLASSGMGTAIRVPLPTPKLKLDANREVTHTNAHDHYDSQPLPPHTHIHIHICTSFHFHSHTHPPHPLPHSHTHPPPHSHIHPPHPPPHSQLILLPILILQVHTPISLAASLGVRTHMSTCIQKRSIHWMVCTKWGALTWCPLLAEKKAGNSVVWPKVVTVTPKVSCWCQSSNSQSTPPHPPGLTNSHLYL